MFNEADLARAAEILRRAKALSLRIATAESCTGGLVAALLTEVPGSSAAFDRGFVVYSNAAKQQMLGVSSSLLDAWGAVSPEVARAMADGALTHSSADIAVSITGVAGPDGGTPAKPVGLVQFGSARRMTPVQHVEKRFGDMGRTGVRHAALQTALDLIEQRLDEAEKR
jgi:nicotinamide-nucleotide amidase